MVAVVLQRMAGSILNRVHLNVRAAGHVTITCFTGISEDRIWQPSELLISSYSTLGSEIGLSLAFRQTDLITNTVSTQDMYHQSALCDFVQQGGFPPHTDLLAMFASL